MNISLVIYAFTVMEEKVENEFESWGGSSTGL